MKPRLFSSLAILLLSLTACATRPAEAAQVPPLVVERVVTLVVTTTPPPTFATGPRPQRPYPRRIQLRPWRPRLQRRARQLWRRPATRSD